MPKIILNDNLNHNGEFTEKTGKPIDSKDLGINKKQLDLLVSLGTVSLYVAEDEPADGAENGAGAGDEAGAGAGTEGQ